MIWGGGGSFPSEFNLFMLSKGSKNARESAMIEAMRNFLGPLMGAYGFARLLWANAVFFGGGLWDA